MANKHLKNAIFGDKGAWHMLGKQGLNLSPIGIANNLGVLITKKDYANVRFVPEGNFNIPNGNKAEAVFGMLMFGQEKKYQTMAEFSKGLGKVGDIYQSFNLLKSVIENEKAFRIEYVK